MRTLEKILLTGTAALITLGVGLGGGACKREYPITPTEPPGIHTPAPSETPVVEPTPQPTPVVKPFELICDTCTAEEFEKYYKIAEDDYNAVKKFMG